MAETRFIKTVTFGGYDKADVDKRLEYLYSKLYDLKNELREAKLALEKYKEGTDEEKAHENVLAVERAKLTELQVKNENISERLKAAEEDNKAKEKETESLRDEVKALKEELDNANTKLSALEAGGDAAALGVVFIEAQKSRDMLLNAAKKEAEELEEKSKQAADDMIIDADNKAMKIIYEAEKQAAEITADAMNKSEQMKVASGNLRATMLEDIKKIGSEVGKLKEVIEAFEKSGVEAIEDSEKLLKSVENQINSGGVPVFRMPEEFKLELPEEPKYKQTASEAAAGSAKKKNDELEKLQAMASAIDGGGKNKDTVDLADLAKQADAIDGGSKKKGGVNLADLAKQADSIDGGSKKKGGVNLADLAKQADAIDGGSSKKDGGGKKKGGIDLAALAKQAAALDGDKK